MKQILQNFRALMLVLVVTIFTGQSWGQTQLNLEFPLTDQTSISAYDADWTGKDSNGDVWSFYGFNNNKNSWAFIKCGYKSAAITSTITSPVIANAVTAYAIVVDKASNVTSAKLDVLKSDKTTVIETKPVTIAKGTVSVDLKGSKNACYRLTIENEQTSSNGTTQISGITLTESNDADGAASQPTLTASTSFTTSTFDVTITNKESGSTVYYTTDGTDPTTSSSSFTGDSKTLTISSTTTVKAMSVITGKSNSSVTSATYTFETGIANTEATAYTVAEVKKIVDAGSSQLKTTEIYVKGTVSKVDAFYSSTGTMTYWIKGDAKEDTLEVYGGLNIKGEKFVAKTDIQEGDEVVVKGLALLYNDTKNSKKFYEINKNNVLISRKTNDTHVSPSFTVTAYNKNLFVNQSDKVSYTYTGDGAVTLESSDPTVADVEGSEGNVIMLTAYKAGTTTITVKAAQTDKYFAAQYTYTLTVKNIANLPFVFKGDLTAANATVGMLLNGVGNYTKAPHLKFDDDNDCITIAYDKSAKFLHYLVKGNGSDYAPAEGQFDVLESADGANFTTVKSYASVRNANNEITQTLREDSRFVKFVYVKKSSGNVALDSIYINDLQGVANFDEIEMAGTETVKNVATDGRASFVDAGISFDNYYASGYFYAFTLTNKTTVAGTDYTNPYESACGGAKSGDNYAVWYDNSYNGGDKVVLTTPSAITGFYVTNTTYAANVILNGNAYARALNQNGDYLKLTVTGYNAEGTATGTVDYNLAEVKDNVLSYVKNWRWVDLTSLGDAVSYVTFAMSGSDSSTYGLNTPSYFCVDDFNGKKPAEDAALEKVDFNASGISSVNAETVKNGKFIENGKIIIVINGNKYTTSGVRLK